MKKYLLILVSILALNSIVAADVDADADNPVEMLRSAASVIMQELKANQALYQRDTNALNQLVYGELVPLVDQRGVARSILGKENWQNATPEQRDEFVQRFTDLVVLTYAGALANYDDERIVFDDNIRGNVADKKRVIVSSVVEHAGNSIPVQFSLIYKENENAWRVYDLNVSGVSMLRSFRTQVSEQLYHMSLAELLEKLAKRQIELEVPDSDSENN